MKLMRIALCVLFVSGYAYAQKPEIPTITGMEELEKETPQQQVSLQQLLPLWEANIDGLAEQVGGLQLLVTLVKDAQSHDAQVWRTVMLMIVQLLKYCDGNHKQEFIAAATELFNYVEAFQGENIGIHGNINIGLNPIDQA